MRIYYLSVAEIPSRIAGSVQVMKMCSAFAGIGHEVVLFARRGPEPAPDPFAFYACERRFGLEFFSGPNNGIVDKIAHPLRVASWVRAHQRPDLLYARNLSSLAAVAGFGVPMVFEAHVLPTSPAKRQLQKWLFNRPNFCRLVTISDSLRNDYRGLFTGLPDDRIVVAHDAADIPAAANPPSKQKPSRLQVGYVGHLYPGKGMEMVAALAELMPKVDFHVVGGTARDLHRWKAKARHTNLRFHGFVTQNELAAIYEELDIVVAPFQRRIATGLGTDDISRWTSPLKVFEYMAHGKPIICSDLPVLREVLSHGVNALLVPPDSPEDWVTSITELGGDPAFRARLGQAARRTLETEHTWERRARQVLAGLL